MMNPSRNLMLFQATREHIVKTALCVTSCAGASGWHPITAGMPDFMMPAFARAMDSKLPPAYPSAAA